MDELIKNISYYIDKNPFVSEAEWWVAFNGHFLNAYNQILRAEKVLTPLAKKKINGLSWSNWNQSSTTAPLEIHYPETVQEIKNIIILAKQNNSKVKAIGGGHAKSVMNPHPNTILISLERFDKIKSITQNTVTCGAGVQLRQVCAALKPFNKQLHVILESGMMHMGGITGAQTNDTLINESAQFSSYCIGYKFIDSDGEERIINLDNNEITNENGVVLENALYYMRSNLGHFGVVYEVTMQTKTTQLWKSNWLNLSTKEFYANKSKYISEQDSVFAQVYPLQDRMLVNLRKFVSPTENVDERELGDSHTQDFLFRYFIGLMDRIDRSPVIPEYTKRALEITQWWMTPLAYQKNTIINPNDRASIWGLEHLLDFEEWALPEDSWDDMAKDYLAMTMKYFRESGFVPNLPCFVYIIPQDNNSVLSRSHDGRMIVLDPNDSRVHDPRWWEFRKRYRVLARKHKGRIHFSKAHNISKIDIAAGYDKDRILDYKRAQLIVDRHGMFTTPYFDNLITAFD